MSRQVLTSNLAKISHKRRKKNLSKFAYIPAKQFTSISKIQNSNLKKTSFENLSIVCMSIQESGIHAALPTCTQRLRRRSLSTRSSLCRTGNKHMGPKEEEKESSNRSRISAAKQRSSSSCSFQTKRLQA